MTRSFGLSNIVATLLLSVSVFVPTAGASPVVWTGLGDGSDWGDSENWSPEIAPHNNGVHYDVYIDNGAATDAAVVLSRHREVDDLIISAGDSLTIQSSTGASLTIADGEIENQGQLQLDHTFGSTRSLIFTGQSTLQGGGSVVLSESLSNSIVGDGASRLTINGHTVSGSGSLGEDGGGGLAVTVGAGSQIVAPHATSLSVDPNELFSDGQMPLVNRGTMKSTAGGRLVFYDGNCDNAGGVIEATGADAVTAFRSRANVTGGTLRSSGGGKIQSWQSGETLAPLFADLTSEAHVELLAGYDLSLAGTIENRSLISLSGATGPGSYLYIKDDLLLRGGGMVELGGDGGHSIAGSGATPRLVNVDNTIRGHGALGGGTVNPLIIENHGTIEASVSGKTLAVDPMGGPLDTSQGLTNAGTLRAASGATLSLSDGFVDNNGGTVEAMGADATVKLGRNLILFGGTLRGGDGGAVVSDRKGSDAPHVGDARLTGKVQVPADTQLQIGGTITLAGDEVLNLLASDTKNAELLLHGSTTLRATSGIVSMHSSNSNRNRILGASADAHLVNESRIYLAGRIGDDDDGPLEITNRAGFYNNHAGSVLIIDPKDTGVGFHGEAGEMQAIGGTIRLQDGRYESDAGTTFHAESPLELDRGVVLVGGKISSLDGACKSIADGADAAVLEGVTIDGAVAAADGMDLAIRGTITGGDIGWGHIDVKSSAGAVSDLRVPTAATLTGYGSVRLNHATGSRVVGDGDASRLTIDQDYEIRGGGQLGADTLAITNGGGIGNTKLKPTLTIDPVDNPLDGAAGFVNRGKLFTFGGTLWLKQGKYDNANGEIFAHDDFGQPGVIQLDAGARIAFGTLSTKFGSVFRSVYTGAANPPVLENLLIDGKVELPDDAALALRGTIGNQPQSVIALDGNSSNSTDLIIQDVTHLQGGGRVTLFDAPGNAIIGGTSRDRLVNVDNTIIGAGSIGRDGTNTSLAVTNRGTIQSFYANTPLLIDPDDAPFDSQPGFDNAGTLLADGIQGISVGDGTFQNDGIVKVLPDSGIVFVGTQVLNFDAANQRLSGGEWNVVSQQNKAASIAMPGGVAVARIKARVILDGPHSFFSAVDPMTDVEFGGYFQVSGGGQFNTVGTLTNAGHVHVGAGSTLDVNGVYEQTPSGIQSGNGALNAHDVRVAGTLDPGESVGTLTFNRLTLLDGARITFEIDGYDADRIHVAGTLPDALIFQENANVFIDPVVLAASDQTEFPLITWDETQQLTRGVFDTLTWQFSRDARLVSEPQVEFRPDSRMVVVTNVSLVPEPSCALLAMVGVLGVWLLPRRVRQAARRV